MRLNFKFSQAEFIKSQHIDRRIHSGLCLSMCIEYINNINNSIPNDFIFFTRTYNFSSRQRALSYSVESGKLQDAVVFKHHELKVEFKSYIKSIDCLNITSDGNYIITLVLGNGGHTVALSINSNVTLFDPNFGEYCADGIRDVVSFLKRNYHSQGVYVYITSRRGSPCGGQKCLSW